MHSEPGLYADKHGVIRNFNHAAAGYEGVAVLQQIVAERLLERLALIKIKPDRIIDLGSGTGRSALSLARKYRNSSIIQLDLAWNMLSVALARSKFPRFLSRQKYLCADAEQLPFAEAICELVFSNLMLQWCAEPDQVIKGVQKILSRDGLFIFSTFGPDTLVELRESWSAVDSDVHVNTFIDMHDIGDALIRSGFENPVMETERFTLTYEDVMSLMKELKQLGASNVNSARRRTLTGRERLHRMMEEYDKRRCDGRLPATYEVIYGHAWKREKPDNNQGAIRETVIPVSKIKRRV